MNLAERRYRWSAAVMLILVVPLIVRLVPNDPWVLLAAAVGPGTVFLSQNWKFTGS